VEQYFWKESAVSWMCECCFMELYFRFREVAWVDVKKNLWCCLVDCMSRYNLSKLWDWCVDRIAHPYVYWVWLGREAQNGCVSGSTATRHTNAWTDASNYIGTIHPNMLLPKFINLYTSTCAGWLCAAIQTPLFHARSTVGVKALRVEPVFAAPHMYRKIALASCFTTQKLSSMRRHSVRHHLLRMWSQWRSYVRATESPNCSYHFFVIYVCSFIEK